MKPHLYQGWYERLNDQEINKWNPTSIRAGMNVWTTKWPRNKQMKPHLYQGRYERLNDQEINKWNPTSIRAGMND